MPELKDHLYSLLANNIVYNSACDVFADEKKSPLQSDRSTDAGDTTSVENEQQGNEDFYIDVLAASDIPFLIYGACFCLASYGTRNALPALIVKKEIANATTINEICGAIKSIRERTGITDEQLAVLKTPDFRKIHWKRSAMAFFCQFSALAISLNLNMEDSWTIALGDLLTRELNVGLDGHDSINSYRICHIDTEEYYTEMKHFDKTLRSEVLLSDAIAGTAITECCDSRLAEIYQELMNEFLNVRIVQEFGQKKFRK